MKIAQVPACTAIFPRQPAKTFPRSNKQRKSFRHENFGKVKIVVHVKQQRNVFIISKIEFVEPKTEFRWITSGVGAASICLAMLTIEPDVVENLSRQCREYNVF